VTIFCGSKIWTFDKYLLVEVSSPLAPPPLHLSSNCHLNVEAYNGQCCPMQCLQAGFTTPLSTCFLPSCMHYDLPNFQILILYRKERGSSHILSFILLSPCLNVSEPYGSPLPLTGMALLSLSFVFCGLMYRS
jgi:hypothetical protein